MEMAMETETPMQMEVVRDARPREAQDKRPGSRALAGARLASIGGERVPVVCQNPFRRCWLVSWLQGPVSVVLIRVSPSPYFARYRQTANWI